ncbi:PEGA domain-containing protein [uncultured Mediterranea sp.]|uniref:PEGA domain-containing protein n=1 Tax=uncultured Mediterranea sp. TaxID=1926662 RepID=UPI0027D9C689|nr:PEGA domain-containing protein [uncultured Mediterranea sp.]
MKKLFILSIFILSMAFKSAAQEPAVADSTAMPANDSLAVAIEPEEEISVTKFSCLTNDLTARVIAPKRDQNNEVCAIIKIVTKDKSLFFEPDALGITAREDQPGEIWLYVPRGAKRITIKHERFGIIRNYFYPEPINEATVYEMMLYVPEDKGTRVVERVVEKLATAQALMMNYSPASAQIYVDDTLRSARNGAYSEIFPVGEHKYRVCRNHYVEESGTFEIVPEHPTVLNVQLPAAYGFIQVKTDMPAANLTINGEDKGFTPYQSDTIPSGQYVLQVTKHNFYPIQDTVQLMPAKTEILDYKMKRIRVNTFLMPQFCASLDADQMSYGLFLGFCRKFGAYFNFHTDGNFDDSFSSVNPDDYIYDGGTKKIRYAASMGIMARVVKKYLYLYGGAGYGVRRYGWDVATNDYETVAIDNHEGGLAELGLIGRYKKLALSAGFRSNFNFNYREFSVGIGLVFGK